MSIELKGNLINFYVRVSGTSDPFRMGVCTQDTQFQISNEVTERRTNCGIKTGVAEPTFNASGNILINANPSTAEFSYEDVKGWQKSRTKLDFWHRADADSEQGLGVGDGYNNFGSGYFTESTMNASAEADGQATFSFTFTGTGTLDVFDTDS